MPSGRYANQKGRDAENSVVRLLNAEFGIPVERRAKRAPGRDAGDLIGWPGVTIQVKARGRSAVPTWSVELQQQMRNAGDYIGLLIHKPNGIAMHSPMLWHWYPVFPDEPVRATDKMTAPEAVSIIWSALR